MERGYLVMLLRRQRQCNTDRPKVSAAVILAQIDDICDALRQKCKEASKLDMPGSSSTNQSYAYMAPRKGQRATWPLIDTAAGRHEHRLSTN
eukprot:scaffold97484_cov37-Prasinocladus_malaysianus.AAC.1